MLNSPSSIKFWTKSFIFSWSPSNSGKDSRVFIKIHDMAKNENFSEL